jgi:hypothetical protein
MKTAAIGLMVTVLLVACSSSDAAVSPSPSTTVPSSPTPVEKPTLTPSGFCADRSVVGDLYHEIRAGTVPYRQVAASTAAVGKLMRANADLASNDLGARKIRQFVLYLNTLRLAILGGALNYPDDYAVNQFTKGLVPRVADIAATLDCPPAA